MSVGQLVPDLLACANGQSLLEAKCLIQWCDDIQQLQSGSQPACLW